MTRTAFRRAIPNVRIRGIVFVMIQSSPNRQPQTGHFQSKDCVEVDGVVLKMGNPKIAQTNTESFSNLIVKMSFYFDR